mmetsp:Transcript_627/g.1147  ORF Transcript_627/g.1147 Transcript_627/m.1147 type:complete len:656 (-) Transcript_627:236-2203(-)
MGREDEDLGEKLSAPPDFDGPTANRRCTDVLCTILLWCMWICMTGLGIFCIQNGDYRLILYPLDYDGNVCGTNYGGKNMTDFPYLYYVNDFSGGVCVKECPTLENLTDAHTLVTYGGLFQTEGSFITSEVISIADYSGNDTLQCTEALCYPGNDPERSFTSFGVNQGKGYAYYAMDTYEVLWRCLFTEEARTELETMINPNGNNNISMIELTNSTYLKQGYNFWSNLYGDLFLTRYYILGLGFGATIVIGFTYAFLMRIPGVLNIMVWTSIFATIGIFFAAGWYAGDTAKTWESYDSPKYTEDEVRYATIASYVLYAVGGLLVLLFLFMRKRIQLAMGCVKETSKAVLAMPTIILFPVFQGIGFMCFMIAWAVYVAYLASMGEFTTTEYGVGGYKISVRWFEFSDFIYQSGWFFLFCFFWTGQFILALGEIIFAMCFAKWYFSREKSRVGSLTVISSISASMWYHSGTAAFGSLIIAIIKMIRASLAYLQRKAEEMDNGIAKAILCCLQCCFWCLEKCMRFLNKNAYIQCAIFGSSFCKSSKEAFFLIMRNAARIGAITYVSGGVVFVGKVFITSLTTGVAYFAISEQLRDELYSVIGPLVFIAVIAWFISGMFMGIYDMGIATILQCFVADEEMFDDDQMYAQGSLKAWVDNHG